MRARRATAVVTGALLLAGCSSGDGDKAAELPQDAARSATAKVAPVHDAPLVDTMWQLVSIRRTTGSTFARPDLDVTLHLDENDRFLIKGCNNVFGPVKVSRTTLWFDGGANTFRPCPSATATAIDQTLLEIAAGVLEWQVSGRTLRLSAGAATTVLDFRVRESAPPPIDTAELGEVAAGTLRCRPVVGSTTDGVRLWVLIPTRLGGPWRLLTTGPAAPGEPPMLSRALGSRAAGPACIAGLAPAGTTAVTYRAGPKAQPVPVAVHPVPGSELLAYAGIVDRRDTGTLSATDAAGTELVSWSTRR